MNNDSKKPANLEQWERTLGSFILNFGALEYVLAAFLKNNMDASEYERVRRWHLHDRVKCLEDHLRVHDYPQEMRDKVTALASRLQPIREFRNHVAHGHLLARWVGEPATLEVTVSDPQDVDRAYSPDTRHVSFDELSRSNNQLTELIEAFKDIAGFKPGW